MELRTRLGEVPMRRVLLRPTPGTATEADVLAARAKSEHKLVELVEGVLVEKVMGTRESLLAAEIARLLGNHVIATNLGIILGADGALRLEPGLVRIPDVCFISWENIPGETMPVEPIASLVPDLAVEVLSEGNTKKEIDRKVRDYFLAGTRLVWVIQPRTQSAEIFTSPTDRKRIGTRGSLDGSTIIPGFRLPLADLFSCLDRRKNK
jgi:Uma2 family endonuclease